ncbi:phosphatase DCR2 [Sodiomyces alkalinus F11]|uniref:Phosphatase DCR2 n=1 Tax=Sodiomyces alkalinus (strain CBS 110278 / VKM F-3762 / F11) TaxID=1314773 RepID=A0A3N2PM04_SODAK|nr:phosphatase DCR2 [Sodiomyces alkalinus F11]ROT35553.1 phosphatase DCR2 [Sodiomyces alkalinus F11]
MVTRRIVRALVQLAIASVCSFFFIVFLDRKFRVLPKAIHNYMPQHNHGLIVTDVTIAQCSAMNPFASCKLDPEKWQRIEKDLYLGKKWASHAYLHVARKKEEDLLADDKIVLDMSVGRLDPTNTGIHGDDEETWEARPLGLWVKRTSNHKLGDSKETVTTVDVLFGDDVVEARDGWSMAGGTPLLLSGADDIPAPYLTIRRGTQKGPVKPQPRIPENGKFKIMQIADLHLSTGVGRCRDAVPDSYNDGECDADPRTLDFMARILDEEKPNLVVLTGDQVNGETAPDAQSAIFKFAQILIKRKIPYAAIFGNHDDEGSLARGAQMNILESLPYSLSRAGPDDIDGVGNYYVEVLARGKSDHSALTLYLLDSHSYSPNERAYRGYDWIKANQIEWFKNTANRLKKKHKEYTHTHMDLAFIHIPLPEYRDSHNRIKGDWREGVTAPYFNSGFRDVLVEQGVLMVSCGHDHVNDYCALSVDGDQKPALWMCYGGGAGFGGYAGYGGYHRRVRLFDVDMNQARIRTWKRLEYGDVESRIDEQIIVDAGKLVLPAEH